MDVSSGDAWDALFSDFYLRAFGDDPHAEETEAQALAAARLAGCPDGGDLLDVPCGFGRHALPLARAGYKVVGVDRSQALIEEARRRGGGERWPKLVRADYRELPQADESFDAALNLFSSLGYLGDEEDTRALAEIRPRAAPGRPAADRDHAPRCARAAVPRRRAWHLVGGGRLLLEQRDVRSARASPQTTQTLIETSGERDSRTFSLRVYTATELKAMLAAAGFEESRAYGDLDGGPLTPESRLRDRGAPLVDRPRAHETRQAVVGDLDPVGRGLQPLPPARLHARVAVDRAKPARRRSRRRPGSPLYTWPPQCSQNDFGCPFSGRQVADRLGAGDQREARRPGPSRSSTTARRCASGSACSGSSRRF